MRPFQPAPTPVEVGRFGVCFVQDPHRWLLTQPVGSEAEQGFADTSAPELDAFGVRGNQLVGCALQAARERARTHTEDRSRLAFADAAVGMPLGSSVEEKRHEFTIRFRQGGELSAVGLPQFCCFRLGVRQGVVGALAGLPRIPFAESVVTALGHGQPARMERSALEPADGGTVLEGVDEDVLPDVFDRVTDRVQMHALPA